MITIRGLTPDDLDAVTRIYAHHVLNGTATFEETPPTLEEMRQRVAKIAERGLPWLVAEVGGAVVGYAYADRFRERSAYRFTLENSVYIAPGQARMGLGRALLAELLQRCEALGYRQVIAVIGDSGNAGSIGLHRAMGFQPAGIYKSVGLKFGRWLDSVLMQKTLGAGDTDVPQSAPERP
jgi:L-amino acid N-acyltransferase YncA